MTEPCGQIIGHGERCSSGWLCSDCKEKSQIAEQERAKCQSQTDVLKKARGAINGLLDIASEENLDSEQAGRAYAALHEIGTALAALEQSK